MCKMTAWCCTLRSPVLLYSTFACPVVLYIRLSCCTLRSPVLLTSSLGFLPFSELASGYILSSPPSNSMRLQARVDHYSAYNPEVGPRMKARRQVLSAMGNV